MVFQIENIFLIRLIFIVVKTKIPITIGDIIIKRPSEETRRDIVIIDTSNVIQFDGKITEWRIFSTEKSNIFLVRLQSSFIVSFYIVYLISLQSSLFRYGDKQVQIPKILC